MLFRSPEPFRHYLGVGQSPVKMNQDEVNKRMANIRPLFVAPDAKDAAEADDDTDADDLGGQRLELLLQRRPLPIPVPRHQESVPYVMICPRSFNKLLRSTVS